MMTALRTLQRAELPDSWIVAGFVRHKVWDHLHGKDRRTFPTDLDVVFFDPNRQPDEDRRIEEQLSTWAPEYPWEVYNQAHMHTYNGHAPTPAVSTLFAAGPKRFPPSASASTPTAHWSWPHPTASTTLWTWSSVRPPIPTPDETSLRRDCPPKAGNSLWPKVTRRPLSLSAVAGPRFEISFV